MSANLDLTLSILNVHKTVTYNSLYCNVDLPNCYNDEDQGNQER